MSSPNPPTSYVELVDVLADLPVVMRGTRRARGLSLRSAADQIGCSFNTLARIEHGSSGVRVSNVVLVMRWLDQTRATS